MKKERKHYTAEEKVAVLSRHLLDKVPVSNLCEELSLKPTVLEKKVQTKDEVLAELMAELVALKKHLGSSNVLLSEKG
jgi:transposase